MTIECLQSGLVYRNPIPHVYSRHAYHPSVVLLPNNDLVVSMCIGEAFEARDLRLYFARSADMGQTWALDQSVDLPGSIRPNAACGRISVLENMSSETELVAFLIRHDRSRPDAGLTNPKTLGFVETELLLSRSRDGGYSWDVPVPIMPPLTGPSFEMNSPVVRLKDGRWILPTSTWRGWDGYCPNGMKAVAFVSRDHGTTWPEYLDVMADPGGDIIYWESKILQLHDERLLAVAWGYNETEGTDLPNQYAVSDVDGTSFGMPMSTGLNGQTLTPILLPDGRILSLYRRMESPGLWANVSRLDGVRWINEAEAPIWGSDLLPKQQVSGDMVSDFHALRFGAPSLTLLPNGEVFAVIWSVEECVGNIRWFRLRVN